MNVYKKLGALMIVLVLAMGLSVTALAATTLDTNGEQGVFTDKDTPVTQSKVLTLDKELKVYNKDETKVNAPTISYTYTIAAATVESGTTVEDKAGVHNGTDVTVTAPVYAGEGNPSISGTVSWVTTEQVDASDTGASNIKNFNIDFSSVAFSKAGVYRYAVTEALAGNDDTYAMSGVTATNGNHVRYVDVYVRVNPNKETDTLKTNAAYWDIYGFTCFYNNASFTDGTKGNAAVKSTGFVAGTTNGTAELTADSYFTYNVVLGKTVVNDADAQANHQFPFTVAFSNSAVSKNVDIIFDDNDSTSTTFTSWDPDAGALNTTGGVVGVVKILSGSTVKYVGIPCGTTVEVYETNDIDGVTYKVATNKDGTSTEDPAVTSTSTTPETGTATAQTTKVAYESTKAVITPTVDTNDTTAHEIRITNTLINISPTGVTLRYAPYLLTLGAGIVALPLTKSYKKREDF